MVVGFGYLALDLTYSSSSGVGVAAAMIDFKNHSSRVGREYKVFFSQLNRWQGPKSYFKS